MKSKFIWALLRLREEALAGEINFYFVLHHPFV